MRRPVSTTVIDLTSDSDPRPAEQNSTAQRPQVPLAASRPPRYNREIIDLSAESSFAATTQTNTRNVPSSPEVEFLSSRRLPAPRPPQQPTRQPDYDLTADDDVEIVRERQINYRRAGPPLNPFQVFNVSPNGGGWLPVYQREWEELMEVAVAFNTPNLDFERVGFVLRDDREESASPAPYSPPEPAPSGFTRSPDEDEILLCPNCGDELCMGNSDVKKQVWIIKGCGHVSGDHKIMQDVQTS